MTKTSSTTTQVTAGQIEAGLAAAEALGWEDVPDEDATAIYLAMLKAQEPAVVRIEQGRFYAQPCNHHEYIEPGCGDCGKLEWVGHTVSGDGVERVADLELALDLALAILGEQEPGDSRAVSDEYVAMAAIRCEINDNLDECRSIIRAAIKSLGLSRD